MCEYIYIFLAYCWIELSIDRLFTSIFLLFFCRILTLYKKLYGENDGRVGMAMCSLAHVKCAKGNFSLSLSLSLSQLTFFLCFGKKSCCFFIFKLMPFLYSCITYSSYTLTSTLVVGLKMCSIREEHFEHSSLL